MAIKVYKATSNGRRNTTGYDFSEITKSKPEKSLLESQSKRAGRNNQGRITVRHQGGGHKQAYRLVDFKRRHDGVEGIVKAVEYDPNRSANIALIQYTDGVKSYIIHPRGLKVGDRIVSGDAVDIKVGNAMMLKNIPAGTLIHNIELKPGKGGELVRAAGTSAQVLGREDGSKYTLVKLSSGETRFVLNTARATVGAVGNEQHELVNVGKAGRKRWLGKRPTVRGSVMNPNDHPHGGGEGRAPIGLKHQKTPWGKPARGVKTRKGKARSNKLIVRRRNSK